MVLIEAEVERITLKTKLDALQETYAPKLEEVQLKAALALRTWLVMVDAKMLIFTSVQNQQSLDSRALLFRTIYHSPLRILVRRCMHMSPQKLMLKQKSSLS